MGIIFEVTLFDLDSGSCSEVHSGLRILTADGQTGYEYYIGGNHNAGCGIQRRYGSNAGSVSSLQAVSCSSPIKCNEVGIPITRLKANALGIVIQTTH